MSYSLKSNLIASIAKNKICRSCASAERSNRPEIKKFFSDNNPNKEGKYWKGKKLSKQRCESISKLRSISWENPTDSMKESLNKNFSVMWGENNPFFKGIPTLLREKHGDDSGVEAWKKSLSTVMSGEGNPMFGRPAPMSGRGISGWYKGWYFRSTLELSYMINVIERFNLKWESAEKAEYKITYEFRGKRTYVADFVIGKYLVECKPKRLIGTAMNLAKFEAAREFCKKNDMKFKVTTPRKFSVIEMLKMHDAELIKIEESKLKKIV